MILLILDCPLTQSTLLSVQRSLYFQFAHLTWTVVELPALEVDLCSSVDLTRRQFLRANNARLAEIESCLILSLKSFETNGSGSAACLNSATYGGEELGLLSRQQDLEDLRAATDEACAKLAPSAASSARPSAQQLSAVKQLFDDLLRDVKTAEKGGARVGALAGGKALEQAITNAAAIPPGLQVSTSSARATAKRQEKDELQPPVRLLHLAEDIARGDCLGQSTVLGSARWFGPNNHPRGSRLVSPRA